MVRREILRRPELQLWLLKHAPGARQDRFASHDQLGRPRRSPAPSSFQAQKTTFWTSPSRTPKLYMATRTTPELREQSPFHAAG